MQGLFLNYSLIISHKYLQTGILLSDNGELRLN